MGDVFVLYPRPLPRTAATIMNLDPDRWLTMDVSSYVRLAPGMDPQAVAGQITAVFQRHLSPAFLSRLGSVIHGTEGRRDHGQACSVPGCTSDALHPGQCLNRPAA